MVSTILNKLHHAGLTLATAESCTGGNIAHRITLVPGASESYFGSVVSYTNAVKSSLLGVPVDTLRLYGAVSEQTVRAMAAGVCRAIGTDCAVATSGIAGPGGGTPQKPVGTVWIAARTPWRTVAGCYHFSGSREQIIEQASDAALALLSSLLPDCPAPSPES